MQQQRLEGMRSISIVFAAIALPTALMASPIIGQIDTFSTTSTLAWRVGASGTSLPLVVSTGGPAGSGDGFLQLTSDGSGASGRLTVFNLAQWTGDFLDAGVNTVSMDLKDFGTTSLSIRIAVKSTTAQTAPGFVSTSAFFLPADGAWHHAVFLLDAADLTQVGTGITLSSLLSNVGEFRIINATSTANLNGVPVVGQLGVDNIQAAAAVPEPATALLLLGGFFGCSLWMRSRA